MQTFLIADVATAQQYVTLVGSILGLILAVFAVIAATPNGFSTLCKVWNWWQRKTHTQFFAEIHRLDGRIDILAAQLPRLPEANEE